MQERQIEKKLHSYAQSKGWLSRKLAWVGRTGAPDRVFIKGGRILFVELKQLRKKPTVNQHLEMTRLAEAGMLVFLVDNIEDGRRLIDTAGRCNDLRYTGDLI